QTAQITAQATEIKYKIDEQIDATKMNTALLGKINVTSDQLVKEMRYTQKYCESRYWDALFWSSIL
ncbi:MAG: hypothetical protein IJY70_05625, partial [Clostridia bacterium]|nr:hypothetical protein [Clostridia bacterium]